MGEVLTAGSGVECGHGGTVAVMSAAKLTVGGKAVLVATDIMGKPVAGCSTPATPTKPCTTVTSVLPPSLALKLTVGKKGVVLGTLVGLTDGMPPGALKGVPNQSKLTAS